MPIAGIGEAGFDDKAGFRYHGFVCGKFRTYGAVKQWLITGSNFFAAYGFGIDLLSKRPDICKHNDFSDKKYLLTPVHWAMFGELGSKRCPVEGNVVWNNGSIKCY